MKPGDKRQSARIVGLEFGLTSLPAHSGDGHPSKQPALVPWVVAMATGALVGGMVVATGNLICRWREYCLRRREIAFNISAHIMEMPGDEGEAAAEGTREVLRYLGEPGDTLGQRARGFIVAGSFRFYGAARGASTIAIDCLGNFGDQIKRLVLGFHRTAVGIVKADNKPFTRKAVFRIFGRHKDSSSVVGLDDSTMDEAGGSGNAATSRVEVLQGQCGPIGFDAGEAFLLAQHLAAVEQFGCSDEKQGEKA